MTALQQGRTAGHLLASPDLRALLRVAAALVLPSLLVVCAYALAPERTPAPSAAALQRVRDLTDLRNALETYRSDRGRYPESPGPGKWAGLYSAWGVSTPDWIPGLAPRYIAGLPSDPRNGTNGAHQYAYKSEGTNFKLLAFYPDQDCEAIKKLRPELLDPLRGGGGPYPCHAYGYWSPGAALW
jgi:hypothetical protein